MHRVEEYWKEADTYKSYLNVTTWKVVAELFLKYIDPQWFILELGCSVGLTLHYLYDIGYKELTGLDINASALEELRKNFPELEKVPLLQGSIPDLMPHCPRFDVIFSKATLCHVPYEYDWVLASIADRADRYIITVENEKTFKERETNRHFKRNYKDTFEQWQFEQVEEIYPVPDMHLAYVARVFRRKE